MVGSLLVSITAIGLSRPDIRRVILPVLLIAGVSLAAYLNAISLYKSNYGTTENYSLYWITLSIGIFFAVLFAAGQAFTLLLGARSLSKFVWPRQDRILARGADQWIDFSRSAWRGLMLGGVQMAYVVFFYAITTNFLGWWSPVTSEYSDIFATPFPFFYAFEVGLSAALIEELAARFIGIGFLLWLFRGQYKWLAVLIPSLLWAFAHTSYVTFPIYARGIELTLVALFLSFIFLKFDLLTSIMTHFTYNMMIIGIVLLRSSEAYYQIAGWVVVLALALPLLPGLYLLIRRSLRSEPPTPETLTLSLLTKADLGPLSMLPVKADWQRLAQQTNRTTLCLYAGGELVGFVTGSIDDQKIGYVDGVYVTPKWRRQYWGTALLDAMDECLEKAGASQIRIIVKPSEHLTRSFLHNLFWRTGLHVLTKDASELVFKTAMKTMFQDLKQEKPGENELEIPRNLI
jgi:ribosomal protein S18 acetylase RimI-like enzyme